MQSLEPTFRNTLPVLEGRVGIDALVLALLGPTVKSQALFGAVGLRELFGWTAWR